MWVREGQNDIAILQIHFLQLTDSRTNESEKNECEKE